MKKKIHPKYMETTVTCGCGETFKTRSTRKTIAVEICSKCHPFYTGKQKFVDAAGQVEKFQKKFGWTEDKVQEVEQRKGPKKPPASPKAPKLQVTASKKASKDAAQDEKAPPGKGKKASKAKPAAPSPPPKGEAED